MKDVELRLLSELMKNSRRSDRELAKVLGVSQPTISRTIKKLEKEGIAGEYTMIPDFRKLGFEIMAITFVKFLKELTEAEMNEMRRTSTELEKKHPSAVLMAMNGMGMGYNRVFISFHRNYSSYSKTASVIRQVPNVDATSIESFVMSLDDKTHFRPLTLSTIAKFVESEKEETSHE